MNFAVASTHTTACDANGQEKETVWLAQAEVAELFGIERPVVLYHLRTIYQNEELAEDATCTRIVQAQNEGGRSQTRKANL